MKKLFSLIICLTISIASFASDKTNLQTPDPASIKADIVRRGTGEQARVRITTLDNKQMNGYIKEAGESTFVVVRKHPTESRTVAYSEVSRVRGPGMSNGAKVGMGLGAFAAGVGIAAGIILAKCRGYC